MTTAQLLKYLDNVEKRLDVMMESHKRRGSIVKGRIKMSPDTEARRLILSIMKAHGR